MVLLSIRKYPTNDTWMLHKKIVSWFIWQSHLRSYLWDDSNNLARNIINIQVPVLKPRPMICGRNRYRITRKQQRMNSIFQNQSFPFYTSQQREANQRTMSQYYEEDDYSQRGNKQEERTSSIQIHITQPERYDDHIRNGRIDTGKSRISFSDPAQLYLWDNGNWLLQNQEQIPAEGNNITVTFPRLIEMERNIIHLRWPEKLLPIYSIRIQKREEEQKCSIPASNNELDYWTRKMKNLIVYTLIYSKQGATGETLTCPFFCRSGTFRPTDNTETLLRYAINGTPHASGTGTVTPAGSGGPHHVVTVTVRQKLWSNQWRWTIYLRLGDGDGAIGSHFVSNSTGNRRKRVTSTILCKSSNRK